MSNRDYQAIAKMLEEIEVIEDLISDSNLEEFVADERTKRAACMTLINIGGLAKSLTGEFRESHTHISWKAIAGMRDITAHKYQTLKREHWLLLLLYVVNASSRIA